MNSLKVPRSVALWTVAVLVTLGVLVSFMESYRALYWWASAHQVHGIWADLWPIQVDAFVAVGELSLFVALVDVWHWKHRSLPWLVAGCGLAVSIAGNTGHVQTHDVFTRATAAVPPITAYVMLAVGLGLLKRVVANPPRKRPGPKPGTPRGPRRATTTTEPPSVDVQTSWKERLIHGPGGPDAPQLPDDWDPESTQAFPPVSVS